MTRRPDADLVVIGLGSAGMTAAETAVGLGLRVVAVERGRVGGDCLWTGCVPSKSLIAAASVVHSARRSAAFGVTADSSDVDLPAVWRHVRAVRDELASGDDDPARFTAMGVTIHRGAAKITGPHEVQITDDAGRATTVTAGVILVCTGGRPAVPEIPGLAEAGYLTNESIFELVDVPRRMVFVGGGPIAVELAQACQRLGITCTILQSGPRLLPRDEPELVADLTAVLIAEGVEVRCHADVSHVEAGPVVLARVDGVERRWPTEAVVVTAGRRVETHDLGLDDVGVHVDDRGIVVDACGRTSVDSIYAAGDVTGGPRFTHAAAHQAVLAVRDAFFPGRGRTGAVVPWATFTHPSLAHAGLTIAEAAARFGRRRVRVHRWSLDHNDRAHTDGLTGAIVLVEHTGRIRSRLVGADILADGAGELINELVLAIERGSSVADLASVVHVYPTVATSIQQLAGRAALARAHRYRWLRWRRGWRWR